MKTTITLLSTILCVLRLSAATEVPHLQGARHRTDLNYIMARSDDFWSAFIHAMDVYNDNLSPVINRAEKNNDIIIFEKYATWCGHCQAMAPNFDGAAKHFNEVGGLLLSKGTCSNNPQLCNYLGVIGYPSFYYGTAEDFRNVRTSPPPSLNELRSVSSAADMIDFLSERFGIESTTTNNNHGTDHTMPPNNDINQTTAPLIY